MDVRRGHAVIRFKNRSIDLWNYRLEDAKKSIFHRFLTETLT
jgi:hypothetical protein